MSQAVMVQIFQEILVTACFLENLLNPGKTKSYVIVEQVLQAFIFHGIRVNEKNAGCFKAG